MNSAVDIRQITPDEAARRAAFAGLLESWRVRTEQALAARLPAADVTPARLHEAMRYSVLGGGKRVRPALVFATGLAVGLCEEDVEAAACAIELVHVYSLVHDDLPAIEPTMKPRRSWSGMRYNRWRFSCSPATRHCRPILPCGCG